MLTNKELNMKISLSSLVIVLLFSTSSQAAWWLSKWGSSAELREPIGDKQIEFKLDGMNCGVSKTEFTRLSDDSVDEFRNLYCWTSKDTQVIIDVHCYYPNMVIQGVTILKGKSIFNPTLFCGPEKKSP